jgi:hypothetical protein
MALRTTIEGIKHEASDDDRIPVSECGDPSERRAGSRRRHVEFVFYRSPSVCGEGHLANVSADGVFVRTDELPKTVERVQIELRAFGSSSIVLDGEVVWTSAEREHVHAGFGVRLVHAPPAYASWLSRRRRSRGRILSRL